MDLPGLTAARQIRMNATEKFLINASDEDIEMIAPTISVVEYESSPVTVSFDLSDAEQMNFITSGILGTIFVIFGTVTNILSIIVWSRKSMRSTTGTYLIALAVADVGELLLFFMTDSIQVLQPDIHSSYAFGIFYSYIGYPLHMLFVTCSIWITVGMTADRCIKVRWMKHAQTLCSQKRALIGIGIIVFLSSLINIPHFMAYEAVGDDSTNGTTSVLHLTEFGTTDGRHHYEFWIQCMFLVLVPVVSIFISNMLIICEVKTVNRQIGSRKGAVGKQKGLKAEVQLTRLLLTVTFTFLVLNSFNCIVQCFGMLKSGDTRIVTEATKIATLGEVINSSVNFLLYCVSGKRFRQELLQITCGRFIITKETKSSHTTATTTTTTTTTTKTTTTHIETSKLKPVTVGISG